MIQNLISTLVNIADTVMLGYVSQTAMSASSLANQYTFILFCLYYGMATRYIRFMCPVLGKR
ncbi:MAG: MATE family efflux transporter [Blautia faecis]